MHRTNNLITKENTATLYETYKRNWIETGLNKFESKSFSENGEDGVVLQIFSEIGAGKKFYVEFGAKDGFDISNTLALRKDHGWAGLLLDCDFENASINLHKEFVSAENIVGIFKKYKVPQDFEFLSLDIDGNDYWVLRSILTTYQPKLFVVETNQLLPLHIPLSIKYDTNRMWEYESSYFGANLSAFDLLAKHYGYTLVCVVDQNAFFLLNSLIPLLKTKAPAIGNIEGLFKPRVPRSYFNPVDKTVVEFSKIEAENKAKAGDFMNGFQPNFEKTMRGGDQWNREWVDVSHESFAGITKFEDAHVSHHPSKSHHDKTKPNRSL